MSRNISGILRRLDYTKHIPAIHRRLDTVARFLEEGQKCVAVTIVDGKLLVSSNKLKYDRNNPLDKSESLKKVLTIFSRIESGEVSEDELYDRMIAPNISRKSDKKAGEGGNDRILSNWATNLPDDRYEEAKKYLAILREPYGYQNNYKAAVKFMLQYMDETTIKACDEDHREELLVIRKNLAKFHERSQQDVTKLLQIFHSSKFIELKECLITPDLVELVFPKSPEEGRKDYHAEMNITDHILAEKISGKVYIGIGKLSCFGCYLDFMVVKDEEGTVSLEFRGTHGVDYSKSRMETRWAKSAAEKFKDCKGITRQENKDVLFAELSDSDEECNATSVIPIIGEAELN